MERKITIEEHVLYKEDYQMKMLKANSPEAFYYWAKTSEILGG